MEFGQLGFRVGKGGHRRCARVREYIRARRTDERFDVAGIGGEGAIKKTARLCGTFRGLTLIEGLNEWIDQ